MKNSKFVIYLLFVAIMLPFSCGRDFLNTQPLDKISSEATWGDGALSEAFVFNVYSFLGYGGFEEEALAAFTDEAMFTHAGRGLEVVTEATLSPSNLGNTRVTQQWGELYLAIRQANTAIERLPSATFTDQDLKDRLLGEAYFLRAYYYSQLVRYYGGVPLIAAPFGLDEDYSTPRNTYEECVNFMVSDCDQAASLLEGKSLTRGRASRFSAMALKSRILTAAASDLHDGPTAQANSTAHASYGNLELVAYTSGDQNARWQAAKAASKALLDATTGYKLDLTAPVSHEEGIQNSISVAMGGGSAAGDAAAGQELIFERTHTALFTRENNWPLGGIHWGINNGPNGYHNWAGNTPIQQLVDDYEMMDGSRFDWNNSDQAAAPYDNRDPRFYSTVMYDGADWKPRPSDVAGLEPANQIQTGIYDDGAGGFINGIDTRQSPIEDWNGSRTHYYVRKYIDPDPAVVDNQSNAQVVPWPFIRYTEIVFNYAEALIELGEDAEARDWLNKVRFRAGMPAIDDSGDALKERYRNEKRIEMAYEEQRYFDARRWLIGPELHRGIKSIDVIATLKPGASPHVPYRYDKDVYNYEYKSVDNTENEVRKWDDKLYFRPISRDEINKNASLVQNPGY